MSSILTNASALSALQSLRETQSALSSTEKQVSSGLAVATAADNASYWSIAAQLGSASGVVSASNQALSQSQAVLSTASSAIASVTSTIAQIESALTQATNPGADLAAIQTTLVGLSTQLVNTVKSASFNGLNVLDNSTLPATAQNAAINGTNSGNGSLAFVSGFNATSTGGSINTITLTTTALVNGGQADTSSAGGGGSGQGILDGNITYTAVATNDATGGVAKGAANTSINLLTLGSTLAAANAAGTNNSASTNVANEAQNLLAGVAAVLNSLTSYAASIGTTQNAMTAASTFNTALTTNYSTGISALVDADMNTASTRLQALQTQEQLGIQSLSIANHTAQLILKLFPLADRNAMAFAKSSQTPAPAAIKRRARRKRALARRGSSPDPALRRLSSSLSGSRRRELKIRPPSADRRSCEGRRPAKDEARRAARGGLCSSARPPAAPAAVS